MKRKPLIFVFCSLLVIFQCNAATAQFRALNGKWVTAAAFDDFLKNQMDSIGMPGLQIAIINHGEIVCHRSVGFANLDTKARVDDQSIFEAASMSKPVFAYLVMKMVDKELINLDTPLYRYMPYPDIANDDRYKLITARIVLTHRTGFPNWRYDDANNKADSSLQKKYGDLYLRFTPGTQYSYSGEGFVFLAKVVAYLNRRNLQTLEPLFEKEVAIPLGMQHAWFTGNEYIARHKVTGYINGKAHLHHATGVVTWPSTWPNSYPDWDSTWFNPAASLHTDAVSYANFIIHWMKGIGLSKTSLEEMLKPQYRIPKSPEDPGGPEMEGLGVFIYHTPYGVMYSHGGSNHSFQSNFVWYATQQSGYIFLTNCDRSAIFDQRLKEFFTNGSATDTQEYPTSKGWEMEEQPLQKGWSQTSLDHLHQFIRDSTQFTSFMIVRHGKIVFDFGDLQENSYIASCRKSILAILYGPYVSSGAINLDATLGQLGVDDKGGLSPHEKEATIRDIISARSGVFHEASNTGDYLAYAPKRDSVKHGEYWLYSNWDFNVAGYVFETLTHRSIYDAVEKMLAQPLHMQDWMPSLQHKDGDTSKSVYLSYPMWFSARDMARIGLLMLNKGKWQDQQVIPASWIDEIVQTISTWTEVNQHVPLFRGTDFYFGYGYMWWLWQNVNDPRFKGAYSAFGSMGQGISVFPAIDAVVVYKTKAAYERKTPDLARLVALRLAVQTFNNQ
jgi:CubicO group peptidase (beta-lactamase class C family)